MNGPAANLPKFFEQREGHALFAPVEVVSIGKLTEMITHAIIFARDHQIERLLIDATGLTGFPNPSIVDRYWIVRQWATASKGRVAAALVLEPHLIDPEHFGVVVAANSGMRADVFTLRPEALEWLMSSRPCSVNPVARGTPETGSDQLPKP